MEDLLYYYYNYYYYYYYISIIIIIIKFRDRAQRYGYTVVDPQVELSKGNTYHIIFVSVFANLI